MKYPHPPHTYSLLIYTLYPLLATRVQPRPTASDPDLAKPTQTYRSVRSIPKKVEKTSCDIAVLQNLSFRSEHP